MTLEQSAEQALNAMEMWLRDAFERFPQLKENKNKVSLEKQEENKGRDKCTISYHLKLNGEVITTFKLQFSYDWASELDDFYKSLIGKY